MSNKRTFDIENIIFLILNPGSGIINTIVGQHFGDAEQIVFVRVLVEVLIREPVCVLYLQYFEKRGKNVMTFSQHILRKSKIVANIKEIFVINAYNECEISILFVNITYLIESKLFKFIVMDIVKNIIRIRKEKGVSQEFIANALNIDSSAVSNIENGKRELKVKELEIIAKTLGVDILYLLTYPHIYLKKEKDYSEPIEAILQLKLTGDKRDKVLKLIFGDNDLEFLIE